MWKTILIDKSVIQGLNPDKARELADTYFVVLPPILVDEMVSMLAKEKKGNKDPENILMSLARKSINGSIIVPHARLLAKKNLLGEHIPMDGSIPIVGGELIRQRDGEFGVYYNTAKDKKFLFDWSRGEFAGYRDKASDIRHRQHEFDYAKYFTEYSDVFDRLPKFEDDDPFEAMDKFTKWFDNTHMANMSPERIFNIAVQDLLNDSEKDRAKKNWKNSGKTPQEFFPYAFHYARINQWFAGIVGMVSRPALTSKKAKFHIDIQYLYYLPFCKIFTTSDDLLFAAAKVFKLPGQNIVPGEEVKCDLKRICAAKEKSLPDKLSSEKIKELSGGEVLQDWQSVQLNRQAGEAHRQDENSTKRFGEEVFVNSDTQESIIKRKREKSSIYSRCANFVDETLKIAGYYEHGAWNDLKENFTNDTAKQIYDLHADIWHPSDPFGELASDLIDNKFQRFLYLGGVEQDDIFEQIFRWSLYLDQVLIPDPFLTPWLTNKQFNPIANPDQIKLEALKLVYFLILISPLVHTGQVLLVPNPADFNHNVKGKIFEILKAGADDKNALISNKDVMQIRDMLFLDLLRIYARLPDDEMMSVLEAMCGEINKDATLKLAGQIRENDLFYLGSGKPSGQMIYQGRSVCFEEALLLSALYDAVPMPSSFEFRKKEFLQESHENDYVSDLNRYLSELNIIEAFLPESNTLFKKQGVASKFRNLIRDFVSDSSKVSNGQIKDIFKEHDKEFHDVSSRFSSKNIPPSLLQRTYKVGLHYSSKGFLTPQAEKVIRVYDEKLLNNLPKYWLDIPLTGEFPFN